MLLFCLWWDVRRRRGEKFNTLVRWHFLNHYLVWCSSSSSSSSSDVVYMGIGKLTKHLIDVHNFLSICTFCIVLYMLYMFGYVFYKFEIFLNNVMFVPQSRQLLVTSSNRSTVHVIVYLFSALKNLCTFKWCMLSGSINFLSMIA